MRGLDLAALAVAGAVALAAARGSANSTSLSAGSDPLVALLPGLVAVAGAIVTARLAGPLLRLAGRGVRRGPASVRLALVSLGREGGRPTLAAAFLVAGIGLGVFAVAYRTTLAQGERDQAAFQVPLDFTLSEGSALRLPLAVASERRYAQLAPGVLAAPVFRAAATAPAPGLPAQATVLGVPASALASIHNWRGEFASVPQNRLAASLRPAQPPTLRGAALPPSAQAVSLAVTTNGRPVSLVLAVEAPSGQFDHIPLGDTSRGATTLHARLPSADRGGRVVGLVVTLRFADAQALAHQGIEGGLTIVARGSLGSDRCARPARGARATSPTGARGSRAGRPGRRPQGRPVPAFAMRWTAARTACCAPSSRPTAAPCRSSRAPGSRRLRAPTTPADDAARRRSRSRSRRRRRPALPHRRRGFVVADEADPRRR